MQNLLRDPRPGETLRVVPLGGLGEIGKNMMMIEYGTEEEFQSIIIDTGIMFPENDMLGIDYIIPDFQYMMDKLDTVQAVFITHGHEDHTGAIAHVMEHVQAPVYATPLTRGLLEVKLKDKGLLQQVTMVTMQAGDTIRVNDFIIEPFHVTHSIPDGVGFGVTTPLGLLVHTSDYKFDHTPVDGWPPDFAKLAEFAGRGVMVLLADSTNADRPGWTLSETLIEAAIDDAFKNAKGRIFVATFASLISRVQLVATIAARYGRKLAMAGYSMRKNTVMAGELGYLDLSDDMLIDLGEIHNYPDDEIVIMATGTQGEPAAVLGRLAVGRHRQLDVQEGDTIIMSSHPIPGNEEMVHRIINRLMQKGAHVIYDPVARVHVSGHASQEEMKLMINMIRPQYLVPVHGELRHLHQHGLMGQELGIPAENIAVVENGTKLTFDGESMSIGERVPGGYVFVDGSGVGDVGPTVMRDREILARDGFVIVNVLVDRDSGNLLDDPELVSRGFVYLRESGDLLKRAEDNVRQSLNGDGNKSGRSLGEHIEKSLERFFYNETKRRPMIFTFVNRA